MSRDRDIRRLKNKKVLLDIIEHPDIRLRNDNSLVGDFNAPGLKEFIANMVYTIHRKNAAGLAAPQVGWNIRLAVAIVDRALPFGIRKPFVMFNPVIVDHDDVQISIDEGCLSCPNETVKINRWNDIIIEYNNISGIKTQARLAGINAIVVQHEIDHLNTKLIIDYRNQNVADSG